MESKSPIETLMYEHRLIERVLGALEARLQAWNHGDEDLDFVERAIGFFREFADGCHHHKEEQILFPALEERGLPRDGGPIGVMLAEHDSGRELIRAAAVGLARARQGDREAVEDVRRSLQQFAELLRGHIFKEDHVLFQMARQVLSEADTDEIGEQFEQSESRDHERWVRFAEAL